MLERFDANKDGKITQDEFTGPPQMFERLDGDGDGEITAAEAAAARSQRGGGQGRRGGQGDGGGRRGGQGRRDPGGA